MESKRDEIAPRAALAFVLEERGYSDTRQPFVVCFRQEQYKKINLLIKVNI